MTHDDVRPSRVVGRQVKRLREKQGISAQRLAERCAELGVARITRSVIANIESRRDAVSVDELVALAAALNVPPTLLLAPFGVVDEEQVAVTPEHTIHPSRVLEWLVGEGPLTRTNEPRAVEVADQVLAATLSPWRDEGAPFWGDAALPIWFAKTLRYFESQATAAAARLRERTKRKGDVSDAQEQFDQALLTLARHREVMERSGYYVPALPEPWADRLSEVDPGGALVQEPLADLAKED